MGEPTRIPLANGRGFALIDAADLPLIQGYAWHLHSNGHGGFYAAATIGNRETKRKVFMHHLISGRGVDHLNRDGLDNRRENLRPATASQQLANTKLRSDNTSGYRGISLDRRNGRWTAYVRIAKRRRSLGAFPTAEDAARAYDAAAAIAYGEFARLNFP